MMNIVLYEPEIPQNTGNIIRLCANAGVSLIVIQPCGFSLSDKHCRRAGLDYHDQACVSICQNWQDFLDTYQPKRWFNLSTKAQKSYADVSYSADDFLLFGPETRGLPDVILRHKSAQSLRIPMHRASRSLNLSNSVAIVLYEAMRQLDFPACH